MRKSKKLIVGALLATVVLVGSTAAVGCAPAGGGGEESPSPPQDAGLPEGMAPPEGVPGEVPYEASMARVAEILGIDQQKLEDAFAQARNEMGDEGPWQRPANGNPSPWGANKE